MIALLWLACAHRAPLAAVDGVECDPQRWPARVRADFARAVAVGDALARRDRFAWEATDRVFEALSPGDSPSAFHGYVVDETTAGAVVHFGRLGADGVALVATVEFDTAAPHGRFRPAPAGAVMPPELARPFLARVAAASDRGFVQRSASYNVDALPWSDDPADGFAVYLIPAAKDYDAVPLGGAWRAHVDAGGAQVVAMEPLEPSIRTVPVRTLREAGSITVVQIEGVPDASLVAWSRIWQVPVAAVNGRDTFFVVPEGACFREGGIEDLSAR